MPNMLTPASTSKTTRAVALRRWKPGLWRLPLPHSRRVLAGVTDRTADRDTLHHALPKGSVLVEADQVHGASLSAIESAEIAQPVPGCDGLLTQRPRTALLVRTADCIPIMLWDPVQEVVGVVHAGWRGLAAQLPMRLLAFARHTYGVRADEVWVALGPAIRSCCYDVGPEFRATFGAYVQPRDGHLYCDLPRCATEQLAAAGVRRSRVLDTGVCTACDPAQWYSLRHADQREQRLWSFIMIRP